MHRVWLVWKEDNWGDMILHGVYKKQSHAYHQYTTLRENNPFRFVSMHVQEVK